jgi:zeta-carotene desaturase
MGNTGKNKPDVIIAGGGLAGMAAAAALCGAGFRVTLLESRPFLGGRAASFPLTPSEEGSEIIDNCQHILLRCCVNLLDFYRRLGVEDSISFHRDFNFIEPGGRTSVLGAGWLPSPLNMAASFLRLPFLGARSKLAFARAMATLRSDSSRREDLDHITMLDWLREKRQPEEVLKRFWQPVLVSAVNAELDRMAALHGLQVFRLAFLGEPRAHEMGVPTVPLGELYSLEPLQRSGDIQVRIRSAVDRFLLEDGRVTAVESRGEQLQADYYICALPFEKLAGVISGLPLDLSAFRHSPITGIHMWFDRTVTDLPHAALLNRAIQWFFNKREGRYLQLVASASETLIKMPRGEIVELARRELAEFLPRSREAILERVHVVKEPHATFTPAPGLEEARPACTTSFDNFFLAGDWTRSGWPSTMEGAVRSGYAAAEAVSRAAGCPGRFLLPSRS